MSIGPRLRFIVFKRDNFTCQYCGKKPPSVELHCDHVAPRSNGGEDTQENLITACDECNLGKGVIEVVSGHNHGGACDDCTGVYNQGFDSGIRFGVHLCLSEIGKELDPLKEWFGRNFEKLDGYEAPVIWNFLKTLDEWSQDINA